MIQETSRNAYHEIKKELGRRQVEVLHALEMLGEACNLAIADYLHLPINQVTPRVNELVKAGVVGEAKKDLSPKTNKRVIYWKITNLLSPIQPRLFCLIFAIAIYLFSFSPAHALKIIVSYSIKSPHAKAAALLTKNSFKESIAQKNEKLIGGKLKTNNINRSLIEQKIADVFEEETAIAIAIAKCESGLNPNAIGDGHLTPSSYGLFQIRAFPERAPIEELLTIEGNIKEAHRLRHAQSWKIWSCYSRI